MMVDQICMCVMVASHTEDRSTEKSTFAKQETESRSSVVAAFRRRCVPFEAQVLYVWPEVFLCHYWDVELV